MNSHAIYRDQTKTRHRAGQPVRGCDASMPAHDEQGRASLLTPVGSSQTTRSSLALTLSRSTGRPFGVGIFLGSSGGANLHPDLASINNTLRDRTLNRLAKGSPCHSKSPRLYGTNPRDGARHNVGPTTQGRGND